MGLTSFFLQDDILPLFYHFLLPERLKPPDFFGAGHEKKGSFRAIILSKPLQVLFVSGATMNVAPAMTLSAIPMIEILNIGMTMFVTTTYSINIARRMKVRHGHSYCLIVLHLCIVGHPGRPAGSLRG